MTSFIPSVCLLAASLFYVNDPVVNMRESPTHDSTVVSQAVFSENVNIKKEAKNWIYIATPDDYCGWIPTESLITLSEPYQSNLTVSRLAAHVYGIKDTEFGPIKTLPYGSKLCALDTTDPRWIKAALPDGKECYIQRGDVAPEKELSNKKDLIAFSQKFLGLPYTWGGRSSFGYDCSGFVQMLYSQIGINLPRDSNQQVLDPRFHVVTIDNLESGDLIFFGRSEQKITHVGMYIGNGQFIHSTVRECQPWIRISHLSDLDWSGNVEAGGLYRTFRQLTLK